MDSPNTPYPPAARALEEAGDKAAARQAFVRSCQAYVGFAKGCAYAFDYLSDGLGGPKDVQAAIPLGELACTNGFPNACNLVGVLFHNATGMNRDLAVAKKFYEAACKGDIGVGCANLGRVLGQDNPTSVEAFMAFRRSCQLDDGQGCYVVSTMLSDKDFAKADSAAAALAAEKAFTLGIDKACPSGTPPQSKH